MSNNQHKQAEFMAMCGQSPLIKLESVMRSKDVPAQAKLYIQLINEEKKETDKAWEALLNADYADAKLAALAELLDGLCDMHVCMMGLCNSLGFPFEMAMDEVFKSNYTKAQKQDNGTYKIVKRADGKVLKPEDYRKADIISILKYRMITGD